MLLKLLHTVLDGDKGKRDKLIGRKSWDEIVMLYYLLSLITLNH